MSEDIVTDNLLTVNPTELYRHIQYAIDTKRAPFIWGDPGIGKSAIIQYVAKKFGYHFEDVRLSQIDSVDLRGLPTKSYDRFDDDEVSAENPERGPIVEWAMPDFLARARKAKLKEGKKTLFFFDEFNSAMKNTLAAAYQLVLDRRIGCFDLGEDDVVIAAGNFETNGGVTTMMPTPLANRFVHYNLKVSVRDWLDFASVAKIHPYITAFIERNKQALHTFDDDKINEDEKAFGTPRSWHFGSDLLYRILQNSVKGNMFIDDEQDKETLYFEEDAPTHKLDEDELLKDVRVAIAGCVGKALSQQFIAFVKIGLDMPLPSKVLDGEIKETEFFKQGDDVSREYIMASSCIHELKIRHDDFQELKKANKEKSTAEVEEKLEKASKLLYRSIENYVIFAKKHFASETFVFSLVQNMIRKHRIQPMPGKVSNEAFTLIKDAYRRASMREQEAA